MFFTFRAKIKKIENKNNILLEKAKRVVQSVETAEQLEPANEFLRLAALCAIDNCFTVCPWPWQHRFFF